MTGPDLDAHPVISPETLATLFDLPPVAWSIYVPCPVCHASRQQPCHGGRRVQSIGDRAHAARQRAGSALHATLWLLVHHPQGVIGASKPLRGESRPV